MILHLHGFIAKKYKTNKIELVGDTMFQLMNGLIFRFGAEFKEDIRANNWHLIKNDRKSTDDIGEQELENVIDAKSLHLVPAVAGASGIVRVIIGAVLVVAGAYFQQPWMVQMGYGMVIGGVTEMLLGGQTTQTPDQKEAEKASPIYNGAENVTTQGGPIPWVYGRVRKASSVIINSLPSSDEVVV